MTLRETPRTKEPSSTLRWYNIAFIRAAVSICLAVTPGCSEKKTQDVVQVQKEHPEKQTKQPWWSEQNRNWPNFYRLRKRLPSESVYAKDYSDTQWKMNEGMSQRMRRHDITNLMVKYDPEYMSFTITVEFEDKETSEALTDEALVPFFQNVAAARTNDETTSTDWQVAITDAGQGGRKQAILTLKEASLAD